MLGGSQSSHQGPQIKDFIFAAMRAEDAHD